MTPPPRCPRGCNRDRGFALIAVLIAVAALAGLALDMILQNRTAIVEAQAEYDRARMEVAANSGLALALAALSQPNVAARWPIDGTPHEAVEGDIALTVRIEDERGKIPLNVLSEQEVRRMFEAAGARGPELDTLTDSFLDWRDDDDERRPFGAESPDYAARGYRSRDGDITSLGELARIRGMTPAILARLAPSLTLWFGEGGGFSERTATPIAVAVMTGQDDDSPVVRDDTGPRRAALIENDADLRGRRLTVRVSARDPRGGRFERATVIELTGNARDPLWIRARY